MRKRGQDVILVSSGAIAFGAGRHLDLGTGKLKLEERPGGRPRSGRFAWPTAYKELLDVHQIAVAQILFDPGRHGAAAAAT